jgi:hypothetical protein
MSFLLLVGLASAGEVDGDALVPVAAEEIGASKDSGSSSNSSGSSKKKNSSDSGDTTFDKGKLWGWTYRPYVTPGGGLTIANGGTSVTGAVDVGVRYWKSKWKGDLSAGGSYTSGSALSGYDVHGGNEFGRREKWWGASVGLVLFYNGYLATDTTAALDPSGGLDIPVELTLGPKKYYVYGGVTPSFLFNKTRHVDTLPFGDELEWEVGAGLKLKWITAEAGFNQRITTVGVINTPTISLSISGLD